MQNIEILLFAIFYNQEIFVFDLYIYCCLTISIFDMTQKKTILIFDIYNEQLSIFHMKHNIKLFNSHFTEKRNFAI